jgi:hypothetical protein
MHHKNVVGRQQCERRVKGDVSLAVSYLDLGSHRVVFPLYSAGNIGAIYIRLPRLVLCTVRRCFPNSRGENSVTSVHSVISICFQWLTGDANGSNSVTYQRHRHHNAHRTSPAVTLVTLGDAVMFDQRHQKNRCSVRSFRGFFERVTLVTLFLYIQRENTSVLYKRPSVTVGIGSSRRLRNARVVASPRRCRNRNPAGFVVPSALDEDAALAQAWRGERHARR